MLGFIIATLGLLVGYFLSRRFFTREAQTDIVNSNEMPARSVAAVKTNKIKPHKPIQQAAKFSVACAQPEHPLFMQEIGGHSVDVIALSCSPDGKVICSVSRDGVMRCTAVSDISSSSQQYVASITLAGVDTYSPLALTWTANSKRVVLNVGHKVVFYKVDLFSNKRNISEAKSMNTPLLRITKIQLIDVEKWMLVAVAGEDEHNEPLVLLFDHNGVALGTMNVAGALDRPLDGGGGKQRSSKEKERAILIKWIVLLEASPDNRYLAISGHVANPLTPSPKLGWCDIGIYEVLRLKDGEPIGLELVFILGGHEHHVSAMTWSPSGQVAVTVCKNLANNSSVWRVWNTAVPKIDLPVQLFATSNVVSEEIDTSQLVCNQPGTVVVFATGCDLVYCSSGNGEVINTIKGALGNSILAASSFFLQMSEDNGDLKWCFATLVKNAKRVVIWKFK